MKAVFITLCIAVSSIMLLFTPEVSIQGITSGLSVCEHAVLPILFPFLVISNLWISLGYGTRLSKIFAPLTNKFFHLPESAFSVLMIGAIGGYPTGAQAATQLYKNKMLSKSDTEALLFFCNNAGPAFLIGIIGSELFQNTTLGVILWGIHIISAFLLGFIFRPSHLNTDEITDDIIAQSTFITSFIDSIKIAGQISIQICTYILFFSVIIQYMQHLLSNSIQNTILFGCIELTSGCIRLGDLSLSQEVVFVIVAALAGWGGLCVNFQTISIIHEAGLSCKKYLTGKILHSAISTGLSCLIVPHLSLNVPCFAAQQTAPIGAVCTLLSLTLLLFLKSSSGKVIKYRI